jgi:hypothetical protein
MAENKPTQNPDEPPLSIEVADPPGEPEEPEPRETQRPAPHVCAGRRPLFRH